MDERYARLFSRHTKNRSFGRAPVVSHLPFDQLRSRLRGPLITSADVNYETSREIWNRLYDRRPRAVVRCESANDVIAAVRFAREYDIEIAVRGGGHHAAGYASTDNGILLNLAGMCTVTVSPVQQRAVAQTGLTWAQFDQVNQAFGLACTGPIVSMTGIAGFTLGGGIGWLHRKLGLGCDSLRSAEVVTADGALVTANDAENPDLFWALRGSGWNFGVVTSMEFQIHPIGPMVVAGIIYFPLDQFAALVERHRQLRDRFPDELTTWFFLRLAPPLPAIPKDWVGRPVVALALCHCGAVEEGIKWVNEFTGAAAPLASTAGALEYRLWQKSLDARWGNGFFNDWRGQYFSELHPAALEILTDYVSRLESAHGPTSKSPTWRVPLAVSPKPRRRMVIAVRDSAWRSRLAGRARKNRLSRSHGRRNCGTGWLRTRPGVRTRISSPQTRHTA